MRGSFTDIFFTDTFRRINNGNGLSYRIPNIDDIQTIDTNFKNANIPKDLEPPFTFWLNCFFVKISGIRETNYYNPALETALSISYTDNIDMASGVLINNPRYGINFDTYHDSSKKIVVFVDGSARIISLGDNLNLFEFVPEESDGIVISPVFYNVKDHTLELGHCQKKEQYKSTQPYIAYIVEGFDPDHKMLIQHTSGNGNTYFFLPLLEEL